MADAPVKAVTPAPVVVPGAALSINKEGEIRFANSATLQQSITNALNGINAERGARLDVMYEKNKVAGVLVIKKNNTWSLSQAWAIDTKTHAWSGQTTIIATW